MQMIAIVDGVTYTGEVENRGDFESVTKVFADVIGNMDSWPMKLEDGSVLVLGKEATQRAQFIFKP